MSEPKVYPLSREIVLPEALERYRDKLDRSDRGCWIWTGNTNLAGYGTITYQRKTHMAHRYFYERMVEPIPAGMQIDHLCRNRACVNPDHLDPVTPSENATRSCIRRGTRRIPKPTSVQQRTKIRREAILAYPEKVKVLPKTPISKAVDRWLKDGKAQGHSDRTTNDRRRTMTRFIWWVENVLASPPELEVLRPETIREFLGYLQEERPGGRWGSEHASANVKVRPATVNAYYRTIRAFANWCISEELISWAPLKNIKEPKVPRDQCLPFSDYQIHLMRQALEHTENPERDMAIFLLLLDTGMRVSELCSLRVGDFDRGDACLHITGKGNKKRQVFMGQKARRAFWRYFELIRRDADSREPLFLGTRGWTPGGPLQARGVYRIISRAAEAAGVREAHRGPHALRRTFAVNFLKGGGSIFHLQQLMGHEDLTVLKQYVRLSETDLEDAHRRASPADRLVK